MAWNPSGAGDDIARAVAQAVGAASMCWEPQPKDLVFRSEEAVDIVDGLMRYLTGRAATEAREGGHWLEASVEEGGDLELRMLCTEPEDAECRGACGCHIAAWYQGTQILEYYDGGGHPLEFGQINVRRSRNFGAEGCDAFTWRYADEDETEDGRCGSR